MPVIEAATEALSLTSPLDGPETNCDWESEVRQAVNERTAGRVRGLNVIVEGSRLVISGMATTYYCKQMATQAVQQFRGRLVVQNNISVIDPRG